MITTVTLNPMLDKTVFVDGLVPGGIVRAKAIDCVVGGKGVNVARQLQRLGIRATVTGFFGGETGMQLERMMDAEGLHHEVVRVAGMTREGVTYQDDAGVMTSIFEPPHAVTPAEVDLLVATVGRLAGASTWLVCCGSSPSLSADGAYAAMLGAARARGVRTALDSYGAPLSAALGAVPDLLKINRHEYELTARCAVRDEKDTLAALATLRATGIGTVVLTDGDRAVFAAHGSAVWKLLPPSIRSVNPTGSGDSMLAGMLYGFEQGWDLPALLTFGVAAGAANAGVREVSACSHEMIDVLTSRVGCQQIM